MSAATVIFSPKVGLGRENAITPSLSATEADRACRRSPVLAGCSQRARTPPTTGNAATMRRPRRNHDPRNARAENGLAHGHDPHESCRQSELHARDPCRFALRPAASAGLAHFLEHLIFKSTRDFSRHQIAATMQRCGNRFDPTTSKEMISIAGTVRWAKWTRRFPSSRASRSDRSLTRHDLETERQVVLEELRDWEVDPSKWIEVLTDQTLWGSHPLGRDTGGTRASVRDISREHVRRFHRKFFHPANAVLSLAGPMSADEMIASANKHFGSWRAAPGAAFPKRPPNVTRLPAAPQGRRSRMLRRADTQQVWFSLSTTTPSYPKATARAHTQLAQVLVGDGDGSRLWDGLRERLGLAYEVYATLDFYADIGVMSAKAAVGRTRAAHGAQGDQAHSCRHGRSGLHEGRSRPRQRRVAAQIELIAEWNAANAARYAELALLDQELATPNEELAMLSTIGAREFNAFFRERCAGIKPAVCAIGEASGLGSDNCLETRE